MAVYFVQRLSDGLIKIGYSNRPVKRFDQIRDDIREPVKILCVLDGDRKQEHDLHTKFADYRRAGEWFEQGRELIGFIRACVDTPHDIKYNVTVEPPRPAVNCICKYWKDQEDRFHGWCQHPEINAGTPCILNTEDHCILREEFTTTIQISYRNRDRLRAVGPSMNLAVEKLLDDAGY